MKKTLIVLVIIACSDLLSNNLYAQNDFALIEKNVNASANELFHDLNRTKDTLVLSGNKKIRYVYSINMSYKRETEQLINANSVKLPIKHLTRGKHVFVVEQMPLKIVFVVKVLQEKGFDASVQVEKLTAYRNN